MGARPPLRLLLRVREVGVGLGRSGEVCLHLVPGLSVGVAVVGSDEIGLHGHGDAKRAGEDLPALTGP